MKKLIEIVNVTYLYDDEAERKAHVEEMVKDNWICSSQVKDSFGSNKKHWCGKFSKVI